MKLGMYSDVESVYITLIIVKCWYNVGKWVKKLVICEMCVNLCKIEVFLLNNSKSINGRDDIKISYCRSFDGESNDI